jgi:NADPH-dependent F420 reductase
MAKRLFLTLGILGGTGKEGQGLAYRWAQAGYPVLIGSRQEDKARAAADDLNRRLGSEVVKGMQNEGAAAACDIAVLTVPYAAQRALLEAVAPHLKGKVLVDVTAPLGSPDPSVAVTPPGGSAAREAQNTLGQGVKVVAAFQSISHTLLLGDGPIECDVLVCGDDAEARQQVLRLAAAAGMVAWDAGPLGNAMVVEGLTAILLGINKRYRTHGAGIRITGGPPQA